MGTPRDDDDGGVEAPGPGFSERSRVRPHAGKYLLQSLLAFVFISGVLYLTREAAHLPVVVSLASTAFLVFAQPGRYASRARNVIGGHWLSTAIGAGVSLLLSCAWPDSPVAEVVFGGAAVGLATLVMTVTNTEHAPAAGTALGMVFGRGELRLLVPAVALGSAGLALVGWALGKRLSDLT